MQIIYIDTLICVNLFIDYMILFVIRKCLHIISKQWRIVAGAVFAGISTLAVFLPFYTTIFSIIYKLIIAVSTILISFGYNSINKLIVRSLTFIGISMLLCGCVLAAELLWNPTHAMVYNDVLYFDISPVLLIVVTVVVFFTLSIYKMISEKHKLYCDIRKVTIYLNKGKKLSFESAVDTGCNLKEPFSGLPVILIEEDLLKSNEIPQNKIRLIPLSTISGSDILTGFKPEKVYINGKEVYKGCYIGICNKKLKGEIKSIMGTELSEAIA